MNRRDFIKWMGAAATVPFLPEFLKEGSTPEQVRVTSEHGKWREYAGAVTIIGFNEEGRKIREKVTRGQSKTVFARIEHINIGAPADGVIDIKKLL